MAHASPATSIRREFLGWCQPALPEAARRLAEGYRQGHTLDLGRVIVVVPGQRAGRRLQELIAFRAKDEGLRMTPPQVVTEGRLPEMLYTPKLPFAGELAQDLAWAKALRDLPAKKRRQVVPQPPAPADALRWLELGKVLRRLHVELAADGLDFSVVPRSGSKLPDFKEAERWEALVAVQRRYLELLDTQKLWDIQTARLKAIELHEAHTDGDIVLLGTVDLNATLRQMLNEVAARVVAYIVAPDDLADHFDALGCLVASKWCAAHVPLRDEQLRQVYGAVEQADGVSDWLGQLEGRFRVDEVAIGVSDELLVPQLQRQLDQCGVKARWVEGARLGETAPYRLLAAAVQYAGRHRYDDLAALLRHPDLEEWLGRQRPDSSHISAARPSSLPAQLDLLYNKHLPSWLQAAQVHPNDSAWPDLASALERIEAWLESASANHPLRDWGGIFRGILGAVYGRHILDVGTPAGEVMHRTARRIIEECDALGAIPEALDTASLSAADAFQAALGPLANEALPPPADAEAVEILGWLELPLDDSRALIVTSFNEGLVPKYAGADAFLPDRLRRELGLLHNERRYARDAYATSALCQSRDEVRILFARKDTKNDPLQPSRLIFACPDETLVARARRFFGAKLAPTTSRPWLLAPGAQIREKSLFEVPAPVRSGKVRQRVSVTEFKDYLMCPYRYYLRRVRRLEAIDDSARELDGGAFGTLIHKVLGAFGRDRSAHHDNDKERNISAYLDAKLGAVAEEVYGSGRHRPAVRLQIEQARRRLVAFASCQAQLVRDGWCIIYAEDEEEDRLAAPFPGEQITLVGRIDRIDFHRSENKVRILDYKTADTSKKPEQTHRSGESWVDLQLPLYRHLWAKARLALPDGCTLTLEECEPDLGYFNLPKQIDKTGVVIAEWDAAAIADADRAAREVIKGLCTEDFEKIVWPAPRYSEDLAAICLDNALSAPALEEESEGDLP